MELKIKNMVCDRCISAVKNVLDKQNISYSEIKLGEVVVQSELKEDKIKELSISLSEIGFELLEDKNKVLLNDIKTAIINYVHYSDSEIKQNISEYLIGKFNYDYQYLSKLFAGEYGVTIERYFITQRVERVKELLEYQELSLKEIAFKLNYSSTSHLSNQFKKETGMSASEYRKIKKTDRKPLDKI